MNWKNEAIERLTNYAAMVQAVENIPLELSRLEKASTGLRGCRTDKIRVSSSPSRQEDILLGNMIKQEALARSYENAKAWVDTTAKALSVLNSDEERILQQMYIYPQKGVVNQLCSELGMEQSSIYRKRDQALYRFTLALFGIN